MQSLEPAPIRKQGLLNKQGGTDGGTKNWKWRYFVLSDHLAYYPNQAAFSSGAKPNLIRLNAYFVSVLDATKNYEFMVHAYPKSLLCRARTPEEMESWVRALMEPLEQLRRPIREVQMEREAIEEKFEEEAAARGGAAGGGGGK